MTFFGLFQVACNFEKDTCGFSQLKSDKFDWIRKSGSTPSSSTGPSNGHGGGGKLLFLCSFKHLTFKVELIFTFYQIVSNYFRYIHVHRNVLSAGIRR